MDDTRAVYSKEMRLTHARAFATAVLQAGCKRPMRVEVVDEGVDVVVTIRVFGPDTIASFLVRYTPVGIVHDEITTQPRTVAMHI